jgi:hypothetical protein
MFDKLKNLFWAFCILACYPLYSIGQIWLFITDRKEEEFYNILSKHSSDWVNAHLILMLSIVLLIPAYLAINHSNKDKKNHHWFNASVFFIVLASFVLFGQFTIDLCLVELFSLPVETSYAVLDKIQANSIIKALFYDNSQLFFLFKFFDFWSLAHICIIVGLIRSRQLPKWAWVVFFAAMLLTTFGILIDPVYGRIIKRLSYALFSVSFLPIAIHLLKQAFAKR